MYLFFFVRDLANRAQLPESVARRTSGLMRGCPRISLLSRLVRSLKKARRFSLSYKNGCGGCGWATGKASRYVNFSSSPGRPTHASGPGPQGDEFPVALVRGVIYNVV